MMPEKLMNKKAKIERPNWRDYQIKLKHTPAKKKVINNKLKFSFVFFILLGAFGVITGWIGGWANYPALANCLSFTKENKIDRHYTSDKLIAKKDVQALLDSKSFVNLKNKSFKFVSDKIKLQVNTSLDINLQHYLLKHLNLSTSRYIGIVSMDPTTGRILSMVGFDKTDSSNNPCVDNRFPAASIFKIVTASAAIEECGFNLNSKLTYNGRKHTLYKSQLKDRTNKYTNTITFGESFAQSVNPVFGKIGAHYLGKTILKDYADAFGFNRNIDFEIQLAPSQVYFSDDPYQWAEVASGFNRKTKISPLHGALMTSAVLNEGQMIEPTIIDRITDENGRVLYRNRLITINRAIKPRASKILNNLMKTTIKNGTCKKVFRGFEYDPTLSKLNIGGKSGSIDNKSHDARYDWFVGFAEEKGGTAKIAVSAIVAHEKYIGTRASQYARMAMKQYFGNYFANKKNL